MVAGLGALGSVPPIAAVGRRSRLGRPLGHRAGARHAL